MYPVYNIEEIIEEAYSAEKGNIYVNNKVKQIVLHIKRTEYSKSKYYMIDSRRKCFRMPFEEAELYIDDFEYDDYKINDFAPKETMIDYVANIKEIKDEIESQDFGKYSND